MDLVIRSVVIFFFVFLVTRVVGKRELSSLEPFDLILLVVIGDLVQQGVTQSDYSVTGAVTVISVVAGLSVLLGCKLQATQVPARARRGAGRPRGGRPRNRRQHARRERITTAELQTEGRQQQVLSVEDMKWAVLETSGRISVIPKSSS